MARACLFDGHISIYNTNKFKIHIVYYMCVKNMSICPPCYSRITWLMEYVGYLYWILICKNMFIFFILILKYVNSIWILFFSCSYEKVSITQQDARKIVGNNLPYAPIWHVRGSEKNLQAAEEESYPGEIELENEGINEDFKNLYCLKLSHHQLISPSKLRYSAVLNNRRGGGGGGGYFAILEHFVSCYHLIMSPPPPF